MPGAPLLFAKVRKERLNSAKNLGRDPANKGLS